MGSDFGEEEEQFFDALEDLCSGSDFSDDFDGICGRSVESVYGIWGKCPESIHERRRTFMESAGRELGETVSFKEMGLHKMAKSCEVLVSNGDSRNGSSCSVSSSHIDSSSDSEESVEEEMVMENKNKNLVCKVKNLDDPTQYVEYVMEMGDDGALGRLREVGSNRCITLEELEESFTPRTRNLVEEKKAEKKKNWIKKLSFRISKNGEFGVKGDDLVEKSNTRTICVNASKKSFREMSALHTRQVFQAHKGPILTMKFSVDGEFLATAGKDGVVRVWKVSEDARLDETDIFEDDPSCVYFPMNNQSSKVEDFDVNREKLKKLKKSRDLACAILPPEVFRMVETPLHEFRGHKAEVLDLSWSKDGFLLSSSVDNTVRLWKVGSDGCQKVFSHKNYVTCVSFNPVNDNYFISGSIDGIVRIWKVSECKVVDYIDIREIVTALSYRLNGKKGIAGSISGNCYFLDFLGNRIRLGAVVGLKGKKKKLARRITGFQFCPSDSKKVMVTVADSLIKVLYDETIICKFKGPWKAGMHVSASFTSDGKHIVSAGEDSSVCVWNYDSLEKTNSVPKKIRSCEYFVSENASIALPWRGTRTLSATTPEPRIRRAQTFGGEGNVWRRFLDNKQRKNPNPSSGLDLRSPRSAPPPDCFPLTRTLFSESLPRGSGTWPEETMPESKSEYKALKSMMSSDNMWAVVIVTAGSDGWIRTYQNYGLPARV